VSIVFRLREGAPVGLLLDYEAARHRRPPDGGAAPGGRRRRPPGLQEALTNVVRHSGARRARVRVRRRGGELLLTVVDDGCGATGPRPVAGHGLTGMGERVRLLGGVLSTRSGPGFAVHARIPAGAAR
jgi:hypothetical protein